MSRIMTIGFCNGCFDDLHEGHKFFLEQAKLQCHYLVVGINSDQSCRRLKGDSRPIYALMERILALQAQCSAFADAIVPFDGAVVPLIESIRPDIIIRGEDQAMEGRQFAAIVRVKRLPKVSTTERAHARNRSLS